MESADNAGREAVTNIASSAGGTVKSLETNLSYPQGVAQTAMKNNAELKDLRLSQTIWIKSLVGANLIYMG
jgi:hypothetical protein